MYINYLLKKQMKVKFLNIGELQEGDSIKGFFLCKSYQCKFTRLGDEYIDCVLANSSGSIRAKIWSFIDEFKIRINKENPLAIKADVISYNNTLELNISSLNIVSSEIYNKYGYSETHLVKAISNKETLLKKLNSYIDCLDTNYKKIVNKIIKENLDKVQSYPSINKPYSFKGGLLTQIVSILDLNKRIKIKNKEYDYNIIIAGIILKNIGCINYFGSDLQHSVSEENYSIGVKLIGVNIISEYASKFVNYAYVCKTNLQNVILSEELSNDINLNYINAIYEFDLTINDSN